MKKIRYLPFGYTIRNGHTVTPGLAVKVRVEDSYTPAAVAQLLPAAVGKKQRVVYLNRTDLHCILSFCCVI